MRRCSGSTLRLRQSCSEKPALIGPAERSSLRRGFNFFSALENFALKKKKSGVANMPILRDGSRPT